MVNLDMCKMDSGDKNRLTLHNEPTVLAAAWLQLCLAIIIVMTQGNDVPNKKNIVILDQCYLFHAFKIESFTINLLHCSDIT